MYQKQTLKAPPGEAAPMLTAELDYKLMQQAGVPLNILSVSLLCISQSACHYISFQSSLLGFISLFSEQMEFFEVFQSVSFCFSTRTCLSNSVLKVKGRIFGIIYPFLY